VVRNAADTSAGIALRRALRQFRRERGLAQRDLLAPLHLSAHSAIVDYETGRRLPPADVLVAYERYFELAVGTLSSLRVQALAQYAAATPAAPVDSRDEAAVPRQLPAAVRAFTGRTEALQAIDRWTTHHPDGSTPVCVIHGMPGVGKTALALHWAHKSTARYPDGQLYINLRGQGPGAPLTALEATCRLLEGLGTAPELIPHDIDAATARLRSLLATKRTLLVLDNAANPQQIRPLIPASTTCAVLVTSRDRLEGLVATDGATSLALDVLTSGESLQLLSELLGPQRTRAEQTATLELADLCGNLPLALRISSAHLLRDPQQSIAAHVDHLRAANTGRLTALHVPDDQHTAVRSAFDTSYATLAPSTRRLFRFLGAMPTTDTTVDSAAALADLSPDNARRELRRLSTAHLIDEQQPGRYTLHDLVRLYASERCSTEVPTRVRNEAVDRLVEWYMASANHAADLLYPNMLRLPRRTGDKTAPQPRKPRDHADASSWLNAELPALLAISQYAAEHTSPVGWQLADTLRGYFWMSRRALDWLAVAEAGAASARYCDDHRARAATFLCLADAHLTLGQHTNAIAAYTSTVTWARSADWPQAEAAAHNNLGSLYHAQGDLGRSADAYTHALEINTRTGRIASRASSLNGLGIVALTEARFDDALTLYIKALRLAREINSPSLIAVALANIAFAHWGRGRVHQALDHAQRSLALARDIADASGQVNAHTVIGAIHRDTDRLDQALTHAADALAVARRVDSQRFEVSALNLLASVERLLGHHHQAIGHHREALVLLGPSGRFPQTEALIGIADAHQRLGRGEEAAQDANHALSIARHCGFRMLEAEALTTLANALLRQGDHAQAAQHATEALTIHRQIGHLFGEARALLALENSTVIKDDSV
jgi:tetratricopeptide (TPR) repeat protein